MKDGSSERSVGSALAKYFDEMLSATRASGRDNRNPHRFRNLASEFAIEAGAGAIAVH